MLEISHVTKKYRDKEALSDVSLTIPQGQIVGLLGENGAGKTTMMKCILGYLRHKGVVTLDGEAIGPGNIHRLSFATCEHSFFPALSPADHRDFYQAHFPAFNDRRFRLLTEFFQLPLHKPLRSFSTGMKNQLEVTLALSQGADYIGDFYNYATKEVSGTLGGEIKLGEHGSISFSLSGASSNNFYAYCYEHETAEFTSY